MKSRYSNGHDDNAAFSCQELLQQLMNLFSEKRVHLILFEKPNP